MKKTGLHLILNGKGGSYPDEHFDPLQLARGIDIEMEHTTNREVAKIIAKQHLFEFPNYYILLPLMEDMLKKEMREFKYDFNVPY